MLQKLNSLLFGSTLTLCTNNKQPTIAEKYSLVVEFTRYTINWRHVTSDNVMLNDELCYTRVSSQLIDHVAR